MIQKQKGTVKKDFSISVNLLEISFSAQENPASESDKLLLRHLFRLATFYSA